MIHKFRKVVETIMRVFRFFVVMTVVTLASIAIRC